MRNSEEIKKDIHTLNPAFTDEFLDLLYEYLFNRRQEWMWDNFKENGKKIEETCCSVINSR